MALTITLKQPVGISECGKRANNEDSIYPSESKVLPSDHLFLVCDGVGGAAKGNIASQLVCENFAKIFQDTPVSEVHFIQTALSEVEDIFEEYTKANPESGGMATTLTLAHFHANGVTVAHIGDSRIYHIRKGQIIYRSQDHSFVQDLVRSGIISQEEAAVHPKRNVITRAIQGSHQPARPDVYVLQDIKAGDYFFLCSDGILESISDEMLCQIVKAKTDNSAKLQKIITLCSKKSSDNYSAYLVQIDTCKGKIDYEVAQPQELIPIENQQTTTKQDLSLEEAPLPDEQTATSLMYQSQETVTVITAKKTIPTTQTQLTQAAILDSAPSFSADNRPNLLVEAMPEKNSSDTYLWIIIVALIVLSIVGMLAWLLMS